MKRSRFIAVMLVMSLLSSRAMAYKKYRILFVCQEGSQE